MKRSFIVCTIYALLNIIFTYFAFDFLPQLGIAVYFIVNVIFSIALIFTANAIINYRKESNIKTNLMNAIVLAVISCAISLAAASITGENNAVNDMVANSLTEDEINQQIYDELDRQAREKMLEEGIIEENDIITSEPHVGGSGSTDTGSTNDATESDVMNGKYSEWDVSVQGQDTLSTIVQTLFSILIAFLGGTLGAKVWRSRNEPN